MGGGLLRESDDRKGEFFFISQPRMEGYIYSKKKTESFLVFLLTEPLAILCDTHLRKCTFRNVPKTSDEQTLFQTFQTETRKSMSFS